MSEVFEAEARLRDYMSQRFKEIEKVSKGSFKKMEAQATAFNTRVKGLGSGLLNLKNILIGYGTIKLFQGTIGQAAEFQARLREVSTLGEEAAANLSGYQTGLLELSKQTGQGLDVLTKGLYDSISAGVDAGNAMQFLEASTRLAIGGATNTATAVDGLTTILGSFNIEADQAGDVSDAFFQAMKFGKTTVSELAVAIGPIAVSLNSANVEFTEMLGAMSTLTKHGAPTAIAATQLRGAVAGLAMLTDDAKEKMNKLGLAYQINREKGIGLKQVFDNLNTAAGGTLEGMKALIPRIEGASAVLSLAQNDGKDFAESLELMENRSGATAKAFAAMADTFEFKANQAKQGFTALAIEIGYNLMPTVEELTKVVMENMDIISRVVKTAGGVITDTFRGWGVVIKKVNVWLAANAAKNANWAAKVETTKETLEKAAKANRRHRDALVSYNKAVTDVSENGSHFIKYLTESGEKSHQAAKRMDQLSEAHKKALAAAAGGETKPGEVGGQKGGLSDKEKADTERKVQAAKQLQDELYLITLTGHQRDLEELRLFEEQSKAVLTAGQEDTETLELAVAAKRKAIQDKAVQDYIAGIQKENMETAKATKYKLKLKEDEAKLLKQARLDTMALALDTFATIGEAMGLSAKKQQNIAAFEAAVHGLLAVNKAYSSGVPPWNIIAAGLVAAKTTANVVKIKSQKLADGRYVDTPTYAMIGEAGPEGVLNARATAAIGGAPAVNALNSGQTVSKQVTNQITYSPNITIESGTATQGVLEIMRDDKEGFANFLKKEIIEPGYLERGLS